MQPSGTGATATVEVEIVSTVEGVARLQADYDRLNRLNGNTLPFALHVWHLTWCRHFLSNNPHIHDEPRFYVLRSGGHCVAIFPFVVSRRRVGPFNVGIVNFLGADPAITEIRGPLIEPGYEASAAHRVQEGLAASADWDWIHWAGVNQALATHLENNHPVDWQPALQSYVLDLPATWQEFHAGLKRNIRESLRHCYNSLKRDGLDFAFQIIETPSEVRAALDIFLTLHVSRADLKSAALHPNRFESQVSRDFLYDICEQMAAIGQLRLFQLVIDSKVVATRIGFVVGNSLYLYYSGFDPQWARYSVMTTTLAEAIKYAIDQGLATVNLSPGKDNSKTRWGPREIEHKSAYQEGPLLRNRLAHRAYSTALSGGGFQSWLLRNLSPARRSWK
jgi:CelD/BcsL family acetyltransferase involved in cellulose biosynthesis